MTRITLFVDVILPLSVPNLFTYRIPFELNNSIEIGKRVIVQFGKGKLYTALIRNIHEQPPKQYESKYIDSILDDEPIVNEFQFKLWEWIAEYYMCAIGEVMNAALPSGLKLQSETKIVLSPEYEKEFRNSHLHEKESLLVEALEIRTVLTLTEVTQIVEQKNVYRIIKNLLEKKLILIEEVIKEKFKPKIETFVKLTEYSDNEHNLKSIFESLEKKSPKQLDVLMAFISISKRYEERKDVKKSLLQKQVKGSDSAIQSLVKKNVFELYDKETGRFANYKGENKDVQLNEIQQTVFEKIMEQFYQNIPLSKFEEPIETQKQEIKPYSTVLLHGVTSSGKTEIYIKLIEHAIAKGKQVLYLLPEIALTAQIVNRLRKYFGDAIGVYHSKFNENERVEIWNNIKSSQPKNSKPDIIIGARSSLFLPFSNLGLVIVDEEHDTSFKQYEPAPRYNARDAAIYLAHIHSAKTLLGSATPSVESYYNAQEGKYGFVELFNRYGGIQMPEILVADVKEAKKKKIMKSHFSPLLLENMSLALENKEQIILFQNRRGFAPQLECNICAWVPHCVNCDVSLTYHKGINMLRCHYCGYTSKPPATCNACGDADVRMKGFGTEMIEEELSIFFPSARIARMDLDTTRSKFAHHTIIQNFEEGNIDILVGTQMVTKGLDFHNVSLVGILNADGMLNFPDFRAFERSFQLMAQVSGRAGRKNKRGKVVIQTHNADHIIIREVIENNYLEMFVNQLNERKEFNYPPFYRLLEITIVHSDKDLVENAAKYAADSLRKLFGNRVLGPEFPIVSRIKNKFHKNILLKMERNLSPFQMKKSISEILNQFKKMSEYKSVRIKLDVDPL